MNTKNLRTLALGAAIAGSLAADVGRAGQSVRAHRARRQRLHRPATAILAARQASVAEGKCGAGKKAEGDKAKCGEGKCGADKAKEPKASAARASAAPT